MFLYRVRLLAVPMVLALLCSTSNADFSGYYAPGNWTVDTVGDGSVDFSGAPASVVINGPDDGSNTFGYTDLYILADATGTFNFDWSYSSLDDPTWDIGYYINNSFVFLSDTGGQNGSVSVGINAGDVIGWSVESLDQLFGGGSLTVSNFSVVPVPEPSAFALLLVGATGLLVRRRK